MGGDLEPHADAYVHPRFRYTDAEFRTPCAIEAAIGARLFHVEEPGAPF
jgi:hypothetical protein